MGRDWKLFGLWLVLGACLMRPAWGGELLVDYDSVWRYEATSAGKPEGWSAPDYDDSSWEDGEGPLGFPNDIMLPSPGEGEPS